jgi:hypothetical protein
MENRGSAPWPMIFSLPEPEKTSKPASVTYDIPTLCQRASMIGDVHADPVLEPRSCAYGLRIEFCRR